MTECGVFGITNAIIPAITFWKSLSLSSPSHCHPELVSGSGFDLSAASGRENRTDKRRIVRPYFLSHLLVSEANVSDVVFLNFLCLQRTAVLRYEIPYRSTTG